MKISLKVSAFHKEILKQLPDFNLFFQKRKIEVMPLKNKTTTFTVLRSPHVDKKSRNQFQLKRVSKSINFKISEFEKKYLEYILLKRINSGIGVIENRHTKTLL